MTIRTDVTIDWESSPRIVKVLAPSTEVTIQDLADTLREYEESLLNLDNPHLIDLSGKEDLGGGVKVGITAEFQDARLAFEARQVALCSGVVTSGDSSGITLVDSLATFQTDIVAAGDWIVNFTDQSVTTTLKIPSEITITHEPLAGGINNTWTVGDAYKVYPVIQCDVAGGNLVAIDVSGEALDSIHPTALTQVIRTSSSSATLQELEAIQYSSYGGGVTVDITSSYSGTGFPIGTPEQPVNNVSDALAIALERGFTALFILGDITLDDGHDYTNLHIYGQSQKLSEIDIDASANVSGTEFYDAYVTGTLDGDAKLVHCRINSLNYVSGYIEQCILDPGTIVLSGVSAHFLDCWSGVPGLGTPTIDMGGSGTSLALRNYNGGIKLINKSGSDDVSIDLNSGQVILDSTVTNGTIVIRGIGKLTDNSIGATVVSDNLLQGDAAIADAVWDEILSGHVLSGSAGEALGPILNRVAGLMQENYYLDNTVYTTYQGQKLLTAGRIRIYSNPLSVGTGSDVIATYNIIASWTNDEMQSYSVVKA